MMVYFLIPIFNEEKNIPGLFEDIGKTENTAERFFVFSDDGSSDNSNQVIKNHFEHANHIILGDGKNYGPGHAFNSGFDWILKNSKSSEDVIVTMEADRTSDIGILKNMLAINKLGYDLVLASVYAQGGGFSQTTFFRKMISFIANMFFRSFFGIKILTLSSFYRVYTISILKKIQEKYKGQIIAERGFICMLEILVKAISCEAKIIEVPMVLHSTKRIGKSKMKIFKTSMAYLKFMMSFEKKG
ncbi:MAG: glycosyltransferase [Bacteroidetes bacterium]|nr:glycosyltransferase [Bacteroidota bacterium]